MDLSTVAQSVRLPTQHDKVFNEECIFSFDNPVRSQTHPNCPKKS